MTVSPDTATLATAVVAYLLHQLVGWFRGRAPSRVAEVTRWAQLAAREARALGVPWEPLFNELASHLHLSAAEQELAKRVVREAITELDRQNLAEIAQRAAATAALFPTAAPTPIPPKP